MQSVNESCHRACTRTVLEKWRGYLQCPIKSNESSCPADTCWTVYHYWMMVDSPLSPSGLTTQSHRFLTSSDKVDQRLVVLRHPVIRPGMELEVRVIRLDTFLDGWFSQWTGFKMALSSLNTEVIEKPPYSFGTCLELSFLNLNCT